MPAPDDRNGLDRELPFDGSVPPPRFVNIETTRFCNLRCRMCVQFQDGTTVSGPHMGIDEFEQIAGSVFPYVERWQPSVSGEPLMSRDFLRMLELAERFGVKAEIYTNGTLLNEAMVKRLAPNLAAVTISFDGASKATFEDIREGADFEHVLGGIRRLIDTCRRTLPADLQPQIGLACTVMERNVREVPQLVRLIADIGGDFLKVNHVFPVTEEMRQQSLARHVDLARRCFDEALEVAREVGMLFRVEALDHITAQTALQGDERAFAQLDGVVQGLEAREHVPGKQRPWPLLDPRHPDYRQIRARRADAAARSGFPERTARRQDAPERGEVWWCEYLWEKAYVSIGGDVRPCCVMGTPVVGNLTEQTFEEIWNNDTYRAMRQRLAARQPVPVCKGCMHIRVVKDNAVADQHLGGRPLPAAAELVPLTPVLDPAQQAPHRTGEPPVLTWPHVDGAREYELQFSLDRFQSILFSTAGPRGGPAIRQNRWEVPRWAWKQAPVDREIWWRAVAKTADAEREVARGSVPAQIA
ncbi:MAG: SPASM domain-containing protein [Planctomycetota bacterium]